MKVSEIRGAVPYEITESIAARGMSEFTPPQELAIKAGVLDGKNMVVASPTASGKTLIAEIVCANAILAKGKKAVYVAPMRALASEKYEEFKSAYPYIKTALSIGDLDSNDQWLSGYQMIFASTEKFDSLIRHGLDWLGSIGCIVFDEVHMLGDESRGPTLELLITKLRDITGAQIIGLSATIGNASELSEWLGAALVQSDFRPVALRKGIIYNGKVYYRDATSKKKRWEITDLESSSLLPEISALEDTLARKKQILSFYSSRRNAEAAAERMAPKVQRYLSQEEKVRLDGLAEAVLKSLPIPTSQCRRLSAVVRNGAAFHHAGLLNSQRHLIEEAVRGNLIKAICSTTTLSLGVNLPAHTVLVKDVHRYDGHGSSSIGINEVTQLFGRAGRPKYDTEGRALLAASSKEGVDLLYKRYIEAGLEPVDSAIGMLPVLRTHLLAFIAEEYLNTEETINRFLAKTFYGFQYKNLSDIRRNVRAILKEMHDWDFIEEDGAFFRATKLGARVSQLYIDPLSAKWMAESLKSENDELGRLFTITNTLEMRPYVRPTEEAMAYYAAYNSALPKKLYGDFASLDYGLYEPDRAFATAVMLHDWMNEMTEPELERKYSIAPGALYTKLTNANWLIYSAMEIAKILKVPIHDLVNLNIRLKYGIKEELLDLVRLEQIGRVRARLLHNNGICSVSDIRANKDKVARLLGKEISETVFRQL